MEKHSESLDIGNATNYIATNADNTSPSQLEDVTLEQDFTFTSTLNLKSPPSRGRSVREFEDQLTSLKKENFNLKLRIYFLEEKMGINYDLDKESIIKKNIELSVDVENMKKELQEKHELLCQAVKAMELEDEEHKRLVQDKEENLIQCQQEIEDLRSQLQELKSENEEEALQRGYPKDMVAYYSSQAFNLSENSKVRELQEQIDSLEKDLSKEKQLSSSLQLIVDQTESFRAQFEILKKELEKKEETINALTDQQKETNASLSCCQKQLKETEERLEATSDLYQGANRKVLDKNKMIDNMICQIEEISRKYEETKSDLDKEHKRVNRIKMLGDLKITQLEEENERQRQKCRDLQNKLESSAMEGKKYQNLAVSKSPAHLMSAPNTDVNSFSVEDPATSTGTSQEDPLHVPIKNSPSSSSVPPSSSIDSIDLGVIEEILQGKELNLDMINIIEHLQTLKTDYDRQKQKIIKLKAEQMKACKIIKGMIDSRNKCNSENQDLKKQVEQLQKELESVATRPDLVENHTTMNDLQAKISELNITSKSAINDEKMEDGSEDDNTQLLEHYKVLNEHLEEKVQILEETLKEKNSQLIELKEQFNEVSQNLQLREEKIVDLEFELLSIRNKSSCKRSLFSEKTDDETEKDQSFYVRQIREKDNIIDDLKLDIEKLDLELKKRTGDLQNIVNNELWEKNRQIERLESQASTYENKDKEITELKHLLSNKELQLKVIKEKISELGIDIELTEDLFESGLQFGISPPSDSDVMVLQQQLKAALEEKDFFQNKLSELQTTTEASYVVTLKEELAHLQLEFDHSEKLRTETNEVCAVLSSRLEELAVFLDSLLKQKTVLGFLGSRENKKLRQIIDQSLDLSRSFSMSMINPEKSLTHLSNLTSILDGSAGEKSNSEGSVRIDSDILPENTSLTFHSHLYENKETEVDDDYDVGDSVTTKALRQQVQSLQYELQVKENELYRLNEIIFSQKDELATEASQSNLYAVGDSADKNKFDEALNKSSSTLKCRGGNNSESESWSEPDRSVSRARIGLETSSRPSSGKRSRATTKLSSGSTTGEDISRSLSREISRLAKTPSKKSLIECRQTIVELHKQICELEEKLLERDNKIATLEQNNLEIKNLLQEESSNYKKAQNELHNLEIKISEIEEKLATVESRKNEAESKIEELIVCIKDIEEKKVHLEIELENNLKGVQDKINNLQQEKDQALIEAREAEKSAENFKIEIEALKEQLDELKCSLRKEYEELLMKRLKNAEEEFLEILKRTNERAQSEINSLQEIIEKMEQEYSRDYIKKCEVEEKMQEVNHIINEVATLKVSVKEYESTITDMKHKEQEQKMKLSEYQEQVTILKMNVDDATLQISDALQEKAKIEKEKKNLEQQLVEVSQKEAEMKKEIRQVQDELFDVKHNYQRQVLQLQNQKSKLEVKISELESANAELYNRLVSLKSYSDRPFSSPLPSANTSSFDLGNRNIPVNQVINYRRQCSDSTEYVSEEHQGDGYQQQNQHIDVERNEANSSPDLGIESDHGRFSSLETNLNVPRPLLQTLELTNSMSNLLDGDNNQVQNLNCGDEHCCKKVLEIATENSELKRKLMRTRRALEETVTQLTLANQRKKQVEKTICRQIHKTSQVLRQAKANLDSGSETDVYKK